MQIVELTCSHYPEPPRPPETVRFGDRPEALPYATWKQVEKAIRRLDRDEWPYVWLKTEEARDGEVPNKTFWIVGEVSEETQQPRIPAQKACSTANSDATITPSPTPASQRLNVTIRCTEAARLVGIAMYNQLSPHRDRRGSATNTSMTNPYAPPETGTYSAAKSMVSAINGLLIGIGIGLQTCDFIDLSPSDYTSLYGWRNGIVICGLLGAALGYFRNDGLVWRWLIFLGFMAVLNGSTIAFTVLGKSPINVYTGTMVLAGFGYMLLGAMIAINKFR